MDEDGTIFVLLSIDLESPETHPSRLFFLLDIDRKVATWRENAHAPHKLIVGMGRRRVFSRGKHCCARGG
jgi:hypothetical protein